MGFNSLLASTAEWMTAVGTLVLAAVTASVLLLPRLWAKRARPALTMDIRKSPPATHRIGLVIPRTRAAIGNALYVRARVTHIAGHAAENAEVMAAGLWQYSGDLLAPVHSFLPLSLKWSHVGGATIRIPEGLWRHCDIGRFVPDDGAGVIFALDTIVQPNAVATDRPPNHLQPGRYILELLLSADDANVLRTHWLIEFGDQWTDDESAMLSRVTIQKTSSPESQGRPSRYSSDRRAQSRRKSSSPAGSRIRRSSSCASACAA